MLFAKKAASQIVVLIPHVLEVLLNDHVATCLQAHGMDGIAVVNVLLIINDWVFENCGLCHSIFILFVRFQLFSHLLSDVFIFFNALQIQIMLQFEMLLNVFAHLFAGYSNGWVVEAVAKGVLGLQQLFWDADVVSLAQVEQK